MFDFLSNNMFWIMFLIVYTTSIRMELPWTKSIRSVSTLLVLLLFIDLARTAQIDPKDSLLIISTVINFYFLVKQRGSGETGEVEETQTKKEEVK